MANSNFHPTLDTVLAVMDKKGYKVFANEKGFDLNIVGIRTKGLVANKFDDFLSVFYRMHGDWSFNVFNCTTDPGAFYLNNPLAGTMGTAILKEGRYKRSHRIGTHKKKYSALVQNAPVTVIRDANRDKVLDLDSGTEQTGMFGINIHRANEFRESIQVDKWSAGCTVVAELPTRCSSSSLWISAGKGETPLETPSRIRS